MAGCCPETIKFPHETSLDQQLRDYKSNKSRYKIPLFNTTKYETTRQFVSYLQFK